MQVHRKILYTITNFKQTAYHHYGRSAFSFIRLVYYSLFRVNTFLLFEKDLGRKLSEVQCDPEIRCTSPSLKELDHLRQGKDFPREFFCDQIHNAKTCCIGFCGEEVAYVHWVYSKGEYSRFVILSEDVCEINHVATLPKFRGRKLSMMMLEYASKSLQGLGYKRIALVVHENNIAFIKNIKRLDFRETKRIRSIGPFNWKVPV